MSSAAAVAAAALQIDGVAGLHGGQFGEIATYQPGERITGVVIGAEAGEVHIVTNLRRNVRLVAEEVRAAVEPIAGVPVVVTVEDVVTDE